MKKLLNAVAIAGALLGASSAGAGTMVTDWSYTVTTQWQNAFTTFSAGAGSQTNNASEISWGYTGGNHADPTQNTDPLTSRSALTITNTPSSGPLQTNAFPGPPPAFGLGSVISHYNNILSDQFATLQKTRIETVLTLTPTNPAAPSLPAVQQVFGVDFIETPNVEGGCPGGMAPGGPNQTVCDDIFVISIGALTQQFVYDDFLYTINIFELSGNLGPLNPAQCIAAGIASGNCIGITTREAARTDVQFAFFINAVPVPEPTSLALFAAALFALGATARRKSS